MKSMLRLGIILMIYSAIAGALLGWVYIKTKPKIDEQAKLEREKAIKEVMPSNMVVFEEKTLSDSSVIIIGYSDSAKTQIVGYAATAVASGFSSNIVSIVGFTLDWKVNAIKVISQSETPGLGTHTQDQWFQEQFAGKLKDELLVDKDGGTLKSITGSTISSRAVTNSIKNLMSRLLSLQSELPTNSPTATDSTAVANSPI